MNTLTNRVKKNKKITSKFVDKQIKISRVSKVTKGGKKLNFRAIVVVGNKKGTVGIGVAKADEIVDALKKAKVDGLKNLIKFPLTKSLSIPHCIVNKFGASKIILKPSKEGTGIIAGGALRIVLEISGIKNISAKQLGSNNLLNNAKACIIALKKLTTKNEMLKIRSSI